VTPHPPSHSDPPAIPDYELLKPIGRGSYGEVWLARSVTGVFRVIKIVRRNRFDNDRPFRRELQGISRFQAIASGRPRQLALLHVGRNEEAGYFYYVMEPADDAVAGSSIHPDSYVPLTLKELLHRRGRLPASDCVQIALDLARALAVLHDERLIHRDIKPSNVIFVQGVPKLADVGLVASSDATLTSVGTHGYVPPEGPGSSAADIYSLGKLVYEMFTGLDRLEFPTLPPHLTEGSDAPLVRELNAIILRACQPQPQQRHASAHDLARDLELVQAGRSVAFYEGIRRRFRLIATAAILIATATATFAFVLTWRAKVLHRANENARRALYRSDIAVAQLAHASGDLGRARAALQRQIPGPGESDLRGIEWNILNHEVRGDGTPLESVPEAVGIRRLVTEPTGQWLAGSLVDDTVALWKLPEGRIVRILTNAPVLGGFTPDGLLVVDEAQRALRFEHPLNGPVRTIQTGQRLYHTARVNQSIFSPQSDFVSTASSDQTVKIWSVADGKIKATYRGLGRPATASAWSHDSASLYVTDDIGNIQFIDLNKALSTHTLSELHNDVYGDLTFSPDTAMIAVSKNSNSVAIVNIEPLKISHEISGIFQPLCFSNDNTNLFALSSDWNLAMVNWKSATVTNLVRFVPENFSLINWTVSPPKSRVALSDRFGRIIFLNLLDFKHQIASVPDKSIIWSLAFSSNGNQVWTGTENGEIYQWDFLSGLLIQPIKNVETLPGEIQSLAVSSCANWLAVGLHSDSTIWIHDNQIQIGIVN
jgi:serine/threonine protein kinase